MNVLQTWGPDFTSALTTVGNGVLGFIPEIFFALAIFAIGWILAALVENLVASIIKSVKLDAALKSAGFEEVVKRAGYDLNSGAFIGGLVKWFIIVVFLIASFDMLHLTEVNIFLGKVVEYLPSVIIAVLILMVAVVIANATQKLVVASARAAHVRSAELIGRIAKWSIWIFALSVALSKLLILPDIYLQVFFAPVIQGVMLALGLAVGLSFGLGGKAAAERIIEKTTHTILEKE